MEWGKCMLGPFLERKLAMSLRHPQTPDPVVSLLSTDPKKVSRDADKGLTLKMLTLILLREEKN